MVHWRRKYTPAPSFFAGSGRIINVELPAQFGPSNPKNSPVLISSETSLKAATVENDFVIF